MNVDFSIKGHHPPHEDACLRGNDNELPEGFELTLIAILKLLSGDYRKLKLCSNTNGNVGVINAELDFFKIPTNSSAFGKPERRQDVCPCRITYKIQNLQKVAIKMTSFGHEEEA